MIKHRKAVAFRVATLALVVAGLALVAPTLVAPAWALDPPPTDPGTCGGLVCDLGLFKGASDPHALPCNDFVCRVFGGKAQAPPPPVPVATDPAPDVKPAKKARRARARAKSVTATATEAAPAEAKPAPAK